MTSEIVESLSVVESQWSRLVTNQPYQGTHDHCCLWNALIHMTVDLLEQGNCVIFGGCGGIARLQGTKCSYHHSMGLKEISRKVAYLPAFMLASWHFSCKPMGWHHLSVRMSSVRGPPECAATTNCCFGCKSFDVCFSTTKVFWWRPIAVRALITSDKCRYTDLWEAIPIMGYKIYQ